MKTLVLTEDRWNGKGGGGDAVARANKPANSQRHYPQVNLDDDVAVAILEDIQARSQAGSLAFPDTVKVSDTVWPIRYHLIDLDEIDTLEKGIAWADAREADKLAKEASKGMTAKAKDGIASQLPADMDDIDTAGLPADVVAVIEAAKKIASAVS